MKQLNLVTVGGVFSLPLARTKSLKTAKAQAELIAHQGVWIRNVFLTPNCIRFIEVADIERPTKKEGSEGTEIAPVPAPPEFHQQEDESCKAQA